MRKNSLIAMLDAAPRRLLSTLLPATLLVIAGISTIPAAKAAEWYSVPPSACVAPFLYQAFPMRWHEAYLMNPADNIPNYVICPITTNAAELAGANYSAQIYGAKMSGASSDTPQCFFGVTDQYNLQQPPYLFGNARRYITALNTLTSENFWVATPSVPITSAAVTAAISPPTSTFTQAMAMWCLLPPGYGISQLVLSRE